MSLSRLAMRLAAVQALRGRTLAGERVFDSVIDPIRLTTEQGRQPLVIVTTDQHEASVSGRDLCGGTQQCSLVIEVAIADAAQVPAQDGQGAETSIEVPHTDEGMELMLDLLEHQVSVTLAQGTHAWSDIWMGFVPSVASRISRRGASSDNGLRFAARQIILVCDLINTPAAVAEIGATAPWGKFLAALDADPGLTGVASMLRAEIDGDGLSDWQRSAQALGIPYDVADMIAIKPVEAADGNPVTLDSVQIDEAGAITTLDEASADAQGA